MRRNMAIKRVIQILQSFSAGSPELGVTDISAKLGLAKSVVHNDLAALVEGNFLARNEKNGKYVLGSETIRLGQVFLGHSSLRRIAFPIIERVSVTLDMTAFLSGWVNSKAYCIELFNSPRPLRVKVTLNIGQEVSFNAGAAGKTLLGFLPDEDREEILKTYVPIRYTRKTITDVSKLRKQLERIQENGYGISIGEFDLDVGAIGVPIFAGDGRAVASLCCVGPVSRFRKNKIMSIVSVLKQAADDISRGLGFIRNTKLR